tara:strand:+ start:4348 stop:5643 length:1296 start_codon:yes stop_codon:yes gene_type:complete
MPPWVYIRDISGFDKQEVVLKGWLQNRRSSGKLHFLQLRDGTGTIQCVVFKGDVDADVFSIAGHLPQESSIIVTGTVRVEQRAPSGFELSIKHLSVMTLAEEYPITPKEHGVAFLLDHRHLWLRSSRQHAILRIRSELIKASRHYFDSRGFTLLDAPVFTPASCEGTTTLFEVDYFGEPAYLTQSGQLYMEAGAMAFGKVYCFGPTFRAEKSKTRRHLMEFWMIEPEVAYFDLQDDMNLAEDFVETIVCHVLTRCSEELAVLDRDIAKLEKIKKPFPRMTYGDAVERLRNQGVAFEWGHDFGADEETLIAEWFDRPVIVHRYPAACKAFYMKNDPDDPTISLSMDMLAPEGAGEIIGGGQREDDLETLQDKITAHGLLIEDFSWYVDVRRYGSVPHAGFGMGIERVVRWVCGIDHVREAIPFPRMLERLRP